MVQSNKQPDTGPLLTNLKLLIPYKNYKTQYFGLVKPMYTDLTKHPL
jgi:hypothetical protein